MFHSNCPNLPINLLIYVVEENFFNCCMNYWKFFWCVYEICIVKINSHKSLLWASRNLDKIADILLFFSKISVYILRSINILILNPFNTFILTPNTSNPKANIHFICIYRSTYIYYMVTSSHINTNKYPTKKGFHNSKLEAKQLYPHFKSHWWSSRNHLMPRTANRKTKVPPCHSH